MRRVLLVPIVFVVASSPSCVFLPRYKAVSSSPRPQLDDEIAEHMNPWLLGEGFADRVAIEVDWVEGCKPGPKTIEGLRTILLKYGPPGRPVDVTLDDEIPLAEWHEPSAEQRDTVQPLVERYADLANEPYDPEFRTERRYVLFAPGSGRGYFGYSAGWIVTRGDAREEVDGVVVFRRIHQRYAKLWLSLDKMERMTLIHEFGHQLGLVANETHERRDPRHRGHCTGLKCAMAHPTPRVIARNFSAGLFNVLLTDYCKRCQDDIRRAQAAWRVRMRTDGAYRAAKVADRQALRIGLSLSLLQQKGEYESVLAELKQERKRFPNSPRLREMQVQSLLKLGRLDEALETFDPDSTERWVPWRLGRALIAAGRHEEAITLFDRKKLSHSEDYDLEQSTFVLLEALEGVGRFDEAISLIDELLARGHSISFSPEGMRAQRTGLLRWAGHLDEALDASRRGLRSKKVRPFWLSVAATR